MHQLMVRDLCFIPASALRGTICMGVSVFASKSWKYEVIFRATFSRARWNVQICLISFLRVYNILQSSRLHIIVLCHSHVVSPSFTDHNIVTLQTGDLPLVFDLDIKLLYRYINASWTSRCHHLRPPRRRATLSYGSARAGEPKQVGCYK